MDTNFSHEELAFRDAVRDFVSTHYTDDIREGHERHEGPEFKRAYIDWQLKLAERGWLAPNWPVEYGGPGWSSTQRYIFDSVLSELGAPKPFEPSVDMVGPVIYQFGTEAQKQRFLPAILRCENWWCQGYSEPGAGSDLAAVATKAVADGDHYLVTGTKVWTTYAQFADWMFCLVRTNTEVRKQAGISFLLIEMNSPGVEVRKIETIDGFHSLNEIRLDGVRVPMANRIGEEDRGWTYAKSLLNFERTILARVADSKRKLGLVKRLAAAERPGGKPLLDHPAFSRRLAKVEVDLMALEFTELRVLASTATGQAPGSESSILKLRGSEVRQAIEALLFDVAGAYQGFLGGDLDPADIGHSHALAISRTYLHGRAASILGGSSEVQRNVIGKAVLGL